MFPRAFIIILTLYVGLASIYSVVNPLFEAPDEVWHYEYVRWLVEGEGLPAPEDVGNAPWNQQGSQPPLYYLSAAALTAWIPTDNAAEVIRYNPHAAIGQPDAYGNKNVMLHGQAEAWPWRGVALAAHIARFFSILLGAVTVTMTYLTARVIFPERQWTALLAAAIVAFNPQFLFLSAAVNNDNLVTCFSAIAIWYGVRLIGQAWREEQSNEQGSEPSDKTDNQSITPTTMQVVFFGLIAGGAALSKLSGLLVSMFVALVFVLIAWKRRSLASLLRWGVISGATMSIVSGWWFLRNWLLFGDPLALEIMFAVLPRRPEPPTVEELMARAEGVWRSVWAVFGWFNVGVEPWVYTFYSALAVVGLAGCVIGGLLFFVRRNRVNTSDTVRENILPENILRENTVQGNTVRHDIRRIQIFLLAVWVSALLLSLLRWAQMRYPQGRLIFPALSATAIILAFGLTSLLPNQLGKFRVRQTGVALLIGALLCIAAVQPWLTIAPTYSATAAATTEAPIETLTIIEGANFGEQVALVGASLPQTELQPGEKLTLNLGWMASQNLERDYSVFVHLIDENGIIQAQRDSAPVRGNYPTSEWSAGEVVFDTHVVDVPFTAPAPSRMKINVGLYDYASGDRLIVGQSDHWTVGFVSLSPPRVEGEDGVPNPVFINFEDKIALTGFEFDRYAMQPGETLVLKLWWETLSAPLDDYVVFTHLILPPEATWAQHDSRPQMGQSPTNTWQVGQRIEDRYELVMPENAPHGVYFLEIGMYRYGTGSRLQVNFSPKGIVLGQVRVGE